MKTDFESQTIRIGIDELVTLALCRRFVRDTAGMEQECRASFFDDAEGMDISHTVTLGDCRFALSGRADRFEGGCLTVAAPTPSPHAPSAQTKRRARARAFLLAALAIDSGLLDAPPVLSVCYYDPQTKESETVSETPDRDAITTLRDRACEVLSAYALPFAERLTARLPAMASLRFPFDEKREGQTELVRSVYRSIKHGTRLYACAPTGIGKTVSVLYPAVRAMGEGHIEKVFYLTPKGTVGDAAADAVLRMNEKGAFIRAVRLYAKETLCARKTVCREEATACDASRAPSAYTRAVNALLLRSQGGGVITARDLTEIAAAYRVCPHELSLCYSEIADVVICDYNYLFDPDIVLRRFFAGGGDYCFLVDEAHMLVERGRDTFSASLSSEMLASLAALCEHTDYEQAAVEAKRLFDHACDALLSENLRENADGTVSGYAQKKVLPFELATAAERLLGALAEAETDKRLERAQKRAIRHALKPVSRFFDTACAYDDDCVTLLSREGDARAVRLYCINPSARLSRAFDRGRSAVLFSATLEPLHYYKSVLGAERSSFELSLPSPFPQENLAVCVMDKISLRFSDRDASLTEILRAVAAVTAARVGNYMVFCPSFEYLERLSALYAQANPHHTVLRQTKGMTRAQRSTFLDALAPHPEKTTVAFTVMGGVFSESVDLTGDRLIGTVVIGVGLPFPTPEREALREYYDERCDAGKEYAYLYPGMNRVLQASGRVIRTESDRGVLVLIDDRLRDPFYRDMIPPHLRHLRFAGTVSALSAYLTRFWEKN